MGRPFAPSLTAPSGAAASTGRGGRMSVAWFTALCLALAAIGAVLTPTVPSVVPFVLALVPAAIAFALAALEGKGAAGQLARLSVRRPRSRRWYLAIAIPPLWALATVAVGVLLGRANDPLFSDLFPAAVVVPLVVLLPALAEEIAWRGFAVPRLATVMSPLAAAVLLAIPWTVMHLVLQLPGGMNAGLAAWPTVVALVAYSVILTWIRIGSGSVLLCALVHAGLNGVVPFMHGIDPDTAWAIRAVLAAGIAAVIIATQKEFRS